MSNILNKVPIPTRFFIGLLTIYQKYLSPLLPPLCRHKPSCSEYMKQAILYHGLLKGCSFGVMRLFRCNPFVKGKKDDVPILYYTYFKNE
jgi:uncharacterized protein